MAMGSTLGTARLLHHSAEVLGFGMLLAMSVAGPRAVAAQPCNGRCFERASVASGFPGEPGNAGSLLPNLSFDGCTVGFKSDATNLVGNDHNGKTDVFVRDRLTDSTTRVSVDAAGLEANDFSFPPALSMDGSLVAFGSAATNLIPADINGRADTFVKDRSGPIDLISNETAPCVPLPFDPTSCGSGSRDEAPGISYDGNLVAFASSAPNLVANDLNETTDVFVYDRTAQFTELISRIAVGVDAGHSAPGPSMNPVISGDGRFVAFVSKALRLVPADTEIFTCPQDGTPCSNVYLWDRQTQTMQRVSLAFNGSAVNGHSMSPTISEHGEFVAFASDASNLVPGDTDGVRDIFIWDRLADELRRVEAPPGCTNGGENGAGFNGFGDLPSISGDGHYLAFVSAATNLIADDANNLADVFVLDRTTGQIARINDADGNPPTQASTSPNISGDGSTIAFQRGPDVFVACNPIPNLPPIPTCTPTPTPTDTPTSTPTVCQTCPEGSSCIEGVCVPHTPTMTASATGTSTVTQSPTAPSLSPTFTPTSTSTVSASAGTSTMTATRTATRTSSTTATSGTPTTPAGPRLDKDTSGCSCRVDPREPSSPAEAALAPLVPLALWLLRRRARARGRSVAA